MPAHLVRGGKRLILTPFSTQRVDLKFLSFMQPVTLGTSDPKPTGSDTRLVISNRREPRRLTQQIRLCSEAPQRAKRFLQ